LWSDTLIDNILVLLHVDLSSLRSYHQQTVNQFRKTNQRGNSVLKVRLINDTALGDTDGPHSDECFVCHDYIEQCNCAIVIYIRDESV